MIGNLLLLPMLLTSFLAFDVQFSFFIILFGFLDTLTLFFVLSSLLFIPVLEIRSFTSLTLVGVFILEVESERGRVSSDFVLCLGDLGVEHLTGDLLLVRFGKACEAEVSFSFFNSGLDLIKSFFLLVEVFLPDFVDILAIF